MNYPLSKVIICILLVLTVLGCTRKINQYHIAKGIEVCGSSEKIDYIDTFIPLSVI